jgi:outer membrane protein TolC
MLLGFSVLLATTGCRGSLGDGCCFKRETDSTADVSPAYFAAALEVEYPDVERCEHMTPLVDYAPLTLETDPPEAFWDMTLEEVIALGLQNSQILRDLGGRVISSPETSSSVYDPAIRESDPQFGPEGALSAFDARLSTGLFWQKNDRVFNNRIQGGDINEFQQDLLTYQTQLSKLAATGTRYAVRHLTRYDDNNTPDSVKIFPENWDTQVEAEIRQPLLQGAGVAFNRIAGPNARPGFNFSSGVLLARINTDVSLADFERSVRDYVSELETAYWELYYAYRALDAAVLARDSALETWRQVEARYEKNLAGGEAFKEARARAQYFQFQDQVQDALNGAPGQGTGSIGVYVGERRLRWLMGLPVTGDRTIRPSDKPFGAEVVFNWDEAIVQGLTQRVELRRQLWQIKRRELELNAARNFLLPRLDAVVQYRLRGFGDDLTGSGPKRSTDDPRFSSAFHDFGSFDHQEWEAGIQLDAPLGFREGWAGVRKAELQLMRERALYREQQNRVSLELSDALGEVVRGSEAVSVSYSRLVASHQDERATQAAFDAGQADVELLLESQQRLAIAQTRYFRSLTDYALALKQVHLAKGTLLEYDGVFLNEGTWSVDAQADAMELERRLKIQRFLGPKWRIEPEVVSLGPNVRPGLELNVKQSEIETPPRRDHRQPDAPGEIAPPGSLDELPSPPATMPDESQGDANGATDDRTNPLVAATEP